MKQGKTEVEEGQRYMLDALLFVIAASASQGQ